MEPTLFRRSSLKRFSSPEKLDEYIKITTPGIWAVLLGCLALLFAVGFWGFYGNIPDSVKARGIMFPQHGVVSVIPSTGGRISDMRVKVGDYVEAGQIIAVIPREDIIRQINELKSQPGTDEQQILKLRNEYDRLSLVVSPVSGIVISARSVNETISPDEAIARIVKQEKYADNRQVICYIPSSVAKKLKEGMEAQVSPDFAPREEYGYMHGYITSVGFYPVLESDVLSAVGIRQYAEGLLPPQESCVEVRITLAIDPNSQNKIRWSNEKGESIPLSIGTHCNVLIIVKNYKPYELLFR